MMRGFGRRGQSTTELAILGTILLLAFAALLKWGQIWNKQQEISMLCFRHALEKAYYDYRGGSGFGGASYKTMNFFRSIEPFNKYYTGSQRQQVAAGNTILWDPDLLYADEGDKPKTYYNIDGDEHDLGKDVKIWDVRTNTVTHIDNLRLEKRTDSRAAEDYVKANIYEDRETIIKLEDGADRIIDTHEEYNKDERWTTSW